MNVKNRNLAPELRRNVSNVKANSSGEKPQGLFIFTAVIEGTLGIPRSKNDGFENLFSVTAERDIARSLCSQRFTGLEYKLWYRVFARVFKIFKHLLFTHNCIRMVR